MKHLKFLIPTVLMGVIMIIFGINKFIGLIGVDPPANLIARTFLGAMFTSYLVHMVGLFEILGGVLLLIPDRRFLGWLILAPVVFNIVVFHMTHDFIGNGIWLLPTLLFVLIGFQNREHLVKILKTH